LELFRTIDEMSREDRDIAKRFLDRFVKNRQEWDGLKREAEE
jgi:hypothetical protein